MSWSGLSQMALGNPVCVSATGSTRVANTTEDRMQIQHQPLGKMIQNQCMRFNKGKSTVMPAGGNKFTCIPAKCAGMLAIIKLL